MGDRHGEKSEAEKTGGGEGWKTKLKIVTKLLSYFLSQAVYPYITTY